MLPQHQVQAEVQVKDIQCAKIARAVVCSDHVLGSLDELKESENNLSEH